MPALVDGEVAVWESLADHGVPRRNPSRSRRLAEGPGGARDGAVDRLRDARRLLRHPRRLPDEPRQAVRKKDRGAGVAKDAARVAEIWRTARERFGAAGPFLFGAFSAADAMYAPMVTRFDTYAIPADSQTRAYMDAVLGTPAFQEWRRAALAETWIVPEDEVDEEPVEVLRKAAAA